MHTKLGDKYKVLLYKISYVKFIEYFVIYISLLKSMTKSKYIFQW